MPNFIPFYNEIWSDKKFRQLSPSKHNPDGNAKWLFIYLFTNHSVTLSGIYPLDIEEAKLKIPIKDFDTSFNEVIQSGMVKWDADNEMMFVVNRFKFIPNKSGKVAKGVIDNLNTIIHPFKDEFLKLYRDDKDLKIYISQLDTYTDKDFNLLNKEQIQAFIKLGWHKDRLKKFYMDRDYPEQKIDSILSGMLPKII